MHLRHPSPVHQRRFTSISSLCGNRHASYRFTALGSPVNCSLLTVSWRTRRSASLPKISRPPVPSLPPRAQLEVPPFLPCVSSAHLTIPFPPPSNAPSSPSP